MFVVCRFEEDTQRTCIDGLVHHVAKYLYPSGSFIEENCPLHDDSQVMHWILYAIVPGHK